MESDPDPRGKKSDPHPCRNLSCSTLVQCLSNDFLCSSFVCGPSVFRKFQKYSIYSRGVYSRFVIPPPFPLQGREFKSSCEEGKEVNVYKERIKKENY